MRLLPSCLLTLLMLVLSHAGFAVDANGVPSLDELKRGAPASVSLSADPVAVDHALIADLQPAHDILHLHGASPLVGMLLLVIAIVPLFFGWRFLRIAISLLLGYFLAMVAWEYGMPHLHQLLPGYSASALVPILIGVSVLCAIIGCVIGWFLYKLEMGLVGAVLGAMVLSIPAMYVNQPVIEWALLAVGVIVGFIAGWAIAPYWAALQTSILGGLLVAQGIAIITHPVIESGTTQMITYAIAIAAAIIGFVVQVLWIGRRTVHGGAPGQRPALSA